MSRLEASLDEAKGIGNVFGGTDGHLSAILSAKPGLDLGVENDRRERFASGRHQVRLAK